MSGANADTGRGLSSRQGEEAGETGDEKTGDRRDISKPGTDGTFLIFPNRGAGPALAVLSSRSDLSDTERQRLGKALKILASATSYATTFAPPCQLVIN